MTWYKSAKIISCYDCLNKLQALGLSVIFDESRNSYFVANNGKSVAIQECYEQMVGDEDLDKELLSGNISSERFNNILAQFNIALPPPVAPVKEDESLYSLFGGRPPSLTCKMYKHILEAMGMIYEGNSGSHRKYRNPKNNRFGILSCHNDKDTKERSVMKGMCQELGVPISEFAQAYNSLYSIRTEANNKTGWYKLAKLDDKIKSIVKRFPGNGIRIWILDHPKQLFVSFGDWADDTGRILKELGWATNGKYKIEHNFEISSPPTPDKRKWRKIANVQVGIDIQHYEASLQKRLMDLVAFTERSKQQNSGFRLNWPLVESTLKKYNLGWQYMQAITNAVQQKNEFSLLEGLTWLSNWLARRKYETSGMTPQQSNQAHTEIWEAIRQLRSFADQLDEAGVDYKPYNQELAQQDFQRLSQETQQNMRQIAQYVQQSISRIENWNGTQVTVIARTIDKDNSLEAENSATIELGNPGNDMNASFTLFEITGKGAIVDDILEGGDTDFFTSGTIQSDYFNLIKEMKNPGSSASGGKIVSVYTARPVKDRSLYENSTHIPSNIFVTNSLNSAEGLAGDLGGSHGRRDVWKLQIDSRYLVQTLDGMEKQYQVIGNGNVPVKRIVLVSPGDE